MTEWIKNVRGYISDRPKIRKIIGIVLVVVGLIALVTPLTPGSWLFFVGLEMLGLRVLFLSRFFDKKQ